MDVLGRISRNQNRRNYVVNWILQNLIEGVGGEVTGGQLPGEWVPLMVVP